MIALSCFSIAAWGSTLLLGSRAVRRPYIGALIERFLIAVLISWILTSGTLITWNRETGYSAFGIDAGRALFTAGLFGLAPVPIVWLLLFATNRLGGGR